MAKILTIGFENMDKMAEVEGVLKALGIKYTVKDVVKAENVNAPASNKVDTKAKDEVKKSAPRKNSSNFDRELYIKCATELGVLGKSGVYKFARQTVYDAMSEVGKSKSGKLTKTVIKSLHKQLLTEAQRLGLQWYIDKVSTTK